MKFEANKTKLILILIFLAILVFRIYTSLNMENLSSDEAYYNLRIINNLVNERSFLTFDQLSYGGKSLLEPQLFHLLLAILSFGSITLLKIIPEIFMALIVFIVYAIAKEISQDEKASLIAALFSGLVPLFFVDTLNVISEYTIALPLLFFMLYCLLKLDDKKYLWAFIACSFILPMIHPIAIFFIAACLFYFLLLSGGLLHPTKLKKEAILTASLIIILIEFIFYKKAFFLYGAEIIWHNAPANIIADAFRKLTVLDLVFGIGLIPLILGSIGLYFGITKEKKKSVYLFSSLAFATLAAIVFRLITLSLGIMILGLTFSILSVVTIKILLDYSLKMRFSIGAKIIVPIILIMFILTSFIPIYISVKNLKDINHEKIQDMVFIKEQTSPGATILTNIKEGNLVTSLAERKSVIDSNLMMAPNPIERLSDTEKIYTTFTASSALELLKRYNITMIYLSDDTRQLYGIQKLNYAEDSNCFKVLGDDYYVITC